MNRTLDLLLHGPNQSLPRDRASHQIHSVICNIEGEPLTRKTMSRKHEGHLNLTRLLIQPLNLFVYPSRFFVIFPQTDRFIVQFYTCVG